MDELNALDQTPKLTKLSGSRSLTEATLIQKMVI